MPDIKKDVTPKEKIDNLYSLLAEFKQQTMWLGGASIFAFLFYHLVKNEDARGLLRELKDGAINLAADMGLDEAFFLKRREQVEKAVAALVSISAAFGAFVVGLCYLLALVSPMIHTAMLRGQLLLPPAILLSALTLVFIKAWALPLLALSAGVRALGGNKHQPLVAEKVLRMLGKTNAWIHFGINVLIIAPFWNSPWLLWMGLGVNLIYVGFCNFWERGQSEKMRRTVLWMCVFTQGILILLSPYPHAVKWLMVEPTSWTNAHFLVPAILFVAIMVFILWLGTRRTSKDVISEALELEEMTRNRDLTRVREAAAMGGVQLPGGQTMAMAAVGTQPILESNQLYGSRVNVTVRGTGYTMLMTALALLAAAAFVLVVNYAPHWLQHLR